MLCRKLSRGSIFKLYSCGTGDNESAKMKESHCVIQEYNGMALVDAWTQAVVHGQPFVPGHDHELLIPMFEGTKKFMGPVQRTDFCLRQSAWTLAAIPK